MAFHFIPFTFVVEGEGISSGCCVRQWLCWGINEESTEGREAREKRKNLKRKLLTPVARVGWAGEGGRWECSSAD